MSVDLPAPRSLSRGGSCGGSRRKLAELVHAAAVVKGRGDDSVNRHAGRRARGPVARGTPVRPRIHGKVRLAEDDHRRDGRALMCHRNAYRSSRRELRSPATAVTRKAKSTLAATT